MSDAEQVQFIRSVLALGDGFQDYGNLWESIWWRTDEAYAPVTFMVNCNDLFYWACSDTEKITAENLPQLLQAIVDVRASIGVPPADYTPYPHNGNDEDRDKWNQGFSPWFDAGMWAAKLFCARLRKMRPQQPYYKDMPEPIKALFDACGPVRDRKDEG